MTTVTDELLSDKPAYQGNRAVSIKKAAEILDVCPRTIWRRIEAGEIAAIKVSTRRRVITTDEINRILSGNAA